MASAIYLGNIVTSANRGRRAQARQVGFRIYTNYRCNNLVYSGVKRLYNDTYVALLIESVDQFGVSKKGYEDEGAGSEGETHLAIRLLLAGTFGPSRH
jgi:hypothetical protein